jgi:hypothetical protein
MCAVDYITLAMTIGSKVEASIYKKISLLLAATLVLVVVVVVVAGAVYYMSHVQPMACPAVPMPCTQMPMPIQISPMVVQPAVPMQAPTPVVDVVRERDERILYDDLYPPLGRSNNETTKRYVTSMKPQPTQDTSDTFRLVGYLVDEEDRNGTWKLFAREQHRNGRAEFYATPSNRNNDMKVVLDNAVITSSEKLKDIYTIPNTITVNHPMFSSNDYKVVQLPKGELGSPYF